MLEKIKNNKVLFIALISAVLLIAGGFAYWAIKEGKTVSTTEGSNDPTLAEQGLEEEREQSQSIDEPTTTEDTEGEDSQPSTSSVVSEDGTITVYTPSSGQVISDSFTISGASEADNVQYRIIDDERGMIGSGELSVVNGKFSGKISNLNHYGSSGIVEVYTINPNTSVELDSVEINVKFGS